MNNHDVKWAAISGLVILVLCVGALAGAWDWSMVIGILFGTAAGGIITWRVSRHYADEANRELRREAGRLRRVSSESLDLTKAIATAFESADLAVIRRDPVSGRYGVEENIKLYSEVTAAPEQKSVPDAETESLPHPGTEQG